jgi:hypothetical protein
MSAAAASIIIHLRSIAMYLLGKVREIWASAGAQVAVPGSTGGEHIRFNVSETRERRDAHDAHPKRAIAKEPTF